MSHEIGHDMIDKGEINVADVKKLISERFTPEEIDAVINSYAIAYEKAGMTADEIWEEVICDSVAEMNSFEGTDFTAAAEMAADFLPDLKEAVLESKKESRGPPAEAKGHASIDFEYTDDAYNDYGWVRDNDILSAGYWKTFTTNFADAVKRNYKFDKTPAGEFMIEAYDSYDPMSVADVVVFAKGTIESPDVTRVVKIDLSNNVEIETKRSELYAAERKGIRRSLGEVFICYNKSDFVGQRGNQGTGIEGVGNNYRLNTKRSRSQIKANRIVEFHINEVNDTITITYANGEVVTKKLGDGHASLDLNEMVGETESKPKPRELSSREILANMLESVAETDRDKSMLNRYKDHLSKIENNRAEIERLKEERKKAEKAKQKKAISQKIEKLQGEIDYSEKRLITLEDTTTLKYLVSKERKARQAEAHLAGQMAQGRRDAEILRHANEKLAEQAKRYQESRKKGVEGRHKTEMRHKIQRVVSELDKLLRKGNKERNVKVGLQDAVAAALEAFDINADKVARYG